MSELINSLAFRAYKELVCPSIEELIDKRLTGDLNAVYEELTVSHRNQVKDFASELGLNELNLSVEEKTLIADRLLSKEIGKRLSYKSKVEDELGLKDSGMCVAITNSLEFSPYFEMLGSPTKQTGFTRSINKLIDICDEPDVKAALTQVRDSIVANWKELNPNTPTPILKDYWFIRSRSIKPIISEWIVKKQLAN